MTEADIERVAERRMDVFDRSYTRGELTDAMYAQLVQDLEDWTAEQHRLIKAANVWDRWDTSRPWPVSEEE
jgi:hypothetical protein